MKYLVNTFEFIGKHILFVIPLFIAYVVPAIVSEPVNKLVKAQSEELARMVNADPSLVMSFNDFFELYSTLLPSMRTLWIISLVSLIPLIIIVPATYGMVNKALNTGNASLIDFFPEFAKNVVKFIKFVVATIIIYFGIGVVVAVLAGICIALMSVWMPLGVLAFVLVGAVVLAGLIASAILLLFSFPAMVSDNLDIFDALKRSVSVGKSYFWYTLAVLLIVNVGSSTISFIVDAFLDKVPYVGSVISSAALTLAQFIIIVFSFEVYRDKTNEDEYINNDENLVAETPNDYLD